MPACELCKREFKSIRGLNFHKFQAHKEDQDEERPREQASSRFQKFPCPSCKKEITEDRSYGDLQAFMCPYCHHLISHGSQEDLGAGGFQVYILQGRAKNHLEATWLYLLEQGWRPQEFLLRNHPRLGELLEEVRQSREPLVKSPPGGGP